MDIDNKNYEGVKVKEEIEDENYHDINHDSIDEGNLSNIFIKQECKLEINWDCAEDEHLAYDENLQSWTSTNVNSTKNCDEKQLFQCPECSVKTKYEANLNKHISFMHPKGISLSARQVPNKNIQNTFVSQTAGNKSNMLLQKTNSLDNYKYFQNEKRSLNKYKLDNRKKFIFRCSDCSFKSNFRNEFIFHTYQCHYNNNSQSEPRVCPHCAKQYDNDYENLKHRLTCRNKVYNCRYLQCYHCSKYFVGKRNLKRHIFNIHFKSGMFVKTAEDNLNQTLLHYCPKCGKTYRHSPNFERHVATCGEKGLYQCNTCLFTTNYDDTFTRHILMHLKKSNLCQNVNY